MTQFYVEIGHTASFSKTVSETDVYLFAGISGDFAPNHVNQAYMAKTTYGKVIAHGALLVGFMSAASTLAITSARPSSDTAVSLGYDRIRFLLPVFLGDTITVHYEITAIDPARKRATGTINVTNQNGELVAIAQHILKWVAAC